MSLEIEVLDDIVFDILGLTQAECDEMNRAAGEINGRPWNYKFIVQKIKG